VIESLKLLHNNKEQFITDLCQWDACGQGFSDTIVSLSIPVLVEASRRLSCSFPSAIWFLFL